MSNAVAILQKQLHDMFIENSGDFAINVEDPSNPYTFKVWSELLRKRSPVFEAMISNGFKESREKVVTLPGFTCDEIKPFLQFLYTGSITLTPDIVAGVSSLADMYEVPSLEQLCSSWVDAELHVHNVAAIYKSALLHKSRTKVIEDCVLFIDTNAPKAVAELHILSDEHLSGILSRPSLCITDQDLADTLVAWVEEKLNSSKSVQSLFSKHVNLELIDNDWRRRLLGPRLKKAKLFELEERSLHVAARAIYTKSVLQAFALERDQLAKSQGNSNLPLLGHWVTVIASNPSCFASMDCILSAARGQANSNLAVLQEGDSLKFFICRQHVRPQAFTIGVISSERDYGENQGTRDLYPMKISASNDGVQWTTLVENTSKCTPMKMTNSLACVFGCRTSDAFQWFKIEGFKRVPLWSFDVDGVILPS